MTVATLSATLSSEWTFLAVGPLEVAVTYGEALFQISDSAPTDPTLSGFPLATSKDPHLFDVASNIYARALSGSATVEYAAVPAAGGGGGGGGGAITASDGAIATIGTTTDAATASGTNTTLIGAIRACRDRLLGILSVATPTPASIVTGQVKIATTGTAVQFPANALVNGVFIKGATTNAANGFVGASSVTNTYGGTGNGFPIEPGDKEPFTVSNTDVLWINGTAGDVFSFQGN